jgi:gamma-glutamyl:cysteine ligase YbdK (ATP-grasp superfamily)
MTFRLDLSAIERALDDLVAFYEARARRGLTAGAADMQAMMRQATAYNDDTGATRAGSVAYVVSRQDSGGAALGDAVDAVEDKNPGESATASGTLRGDLGVVATVPTAYQRYLEVERAGENAVLGPALSAFADELTARAAEGR